MADAQRGLQVRLAQTRPIALDVEFSVSPGEIMALVGPSGSGKSTTLRAVAGLTQASDGRIVCGAAVWFDRASGIHVAPQSRRVGLVFQSYALFPHMTAIENVMEALRDRPAGVRQNEARALLARVHLEGLEERRPADLSGGQQQRVAVARALARRPEALLLDEPFSAVDLMTRQRLQRELAELRRDLSMPIVLVTHDLDEAVRLADSMCVMHRGSSLQVGRVEEVMHRPASPTVARLVGIRNVFTGELGKERTPDGSLRLVWQGHCLETAIRDGPAPGTRVDWCIGDDGVIVHRRERPSLGERENPVSGVVREAVRLGATTELVIDVSGEAAQPVHCSIPTHVAWRNGIEPGVKIGFSLRAAAIHIMPETGS